MAHYYPAEAVRALFGRFPAAVPRVLADLRREDGVLERAARGGMTVFPWPYPPNDREPAECCCLVAFAACGGDIGGRTVGDVYAAYRAAVPPTIGSGLLTWFDFTPWPDVRAALAAECEAVLSETPTPTLGVMS